jgi:hypothetical protein
MGKKKSDKEAKKKSGWTEKEIFCSPEAEFAI